MQKLHPKSKNIAKNFIKLANINIWRSHKEVFYECSNNPFNDQLGKLLGFDLKSYQQVIRNNNDGLLPDGYYFVNHDNQTGNFLETDDYITAMNLLVEKGLITPAN